MKIQQERLGRSLDRLSKDLYNKDTHFVLELIQNADDNSYPETMKEGQCPAVTFVMEENAIRVMNNESGFEEKHIRALCDVGRSTKGKHKYGYIGNKKQVNSNLRYMSCTMKETNSGKTVEQTKSNVE